MRGPWGWLCVLLLTPGVNSQSPEFSAPTDYHFQTTDSLPTPTFGDADPAAPGAGLQHFFNAKLLLGYPTGVRLQAAVDRGPSRTWVVEAFAGTAFFVPIIGTGSTPVVAGLALFNPVVGTGGRVIFAPVTGRGGDALILSPGLNFYYCVGDHSKGEHLWLASRLDGYFLVPDLEISWLHDFASHFGWEIGLDVGLGVGFWQGTRDLSSRTTPIPMLSVFSGFRF